VRIIFGSMCVKSEFPTFLKGRGQLCTPPFFVVTPTLVLGNVLHAACVVLLVALP
jgi:hypothetical protein